VCGYRGRVANVVRRRAWRAVFHAAEHHFALEIARCIALKAIDKNTFI
jgi:hypothetical protein